MKRVFILILALALLAAPFAVADGYEAGDSVFLGSYEQDGDDSNGAEPIEWIVIDKKDDGSVMLLSRYALDRGVYKERGVPTTWETSPLRAWLNDVFFAAAFTEEEQAKIALSTVVADRSYGEPYDPGPDTADHVFLLSQAEYDRCIVDRPYEFCAPTAYAVANGVKQSEDLEADGTGACWYWLRSPDAEYVAFCSPGPGIDTQAVGVRPVIWAFLEP